jgi:cytoskeletal protein CcmA (bactofilin family)
MAPPEDSRLNIDDDLPATAGDWSSPARYGEPQFGGDTASRASGEMPLHTRREVSVLGATLTFRGKLSAQEDLLIQGRIEGEVRQPNHELTVGTDGSIVGDISARRVAIEGKVTGDIHASESVTVRETAEVRGNVFAPSVAIREGAYFKGGIDMDGTAEKPGSRQKIRGKRSKRKQAAGGLSDADVDQLLTDSPEDESGA